MSQFQVEFECLASGHLDDTRGAVWRHVMVFFCCFIRSEEGVQSYFGIRGSI